AGGGEHQAGGVGLGKRDPTDAIFSALADATRRQVIRALSEQGPATATGLASALPVTRQAVTKHLSVLAEAGLVTATRRGREKLYRISPQPLTGAVSWMADLGGRWDDRLAALREHIASSKRRRGAHRPPNPQAGPACSLTKQHGLPRLRLPSTRIHHPLAEVPMKLLALGLALLLSALGSTAARADNTQGITDTTIKIGNL